MIIKSLTQGTLDIGAGVSIEYGNNCLIFTEDGGAVFQINCFLDARSFSLDQFEFVLTWSEEVRPNKCVRIKVEGSETVPIGYIYSAAMLDPGSGIESEKKWEKAYARAAALALVTTNIASEYVIPLNKIDPVNELNISSAFPDHLSLAVIGKSNLIENRFTMSEVRFMLQEHGYRTLSQKLLAVHKKEFSSTISLGKVSDNLKDNIDQFSIVLETASRMNHAPSRFICLYQIFEVIIEKIFEFRFRKIVNGVHALNPWKMKEELASISSEKYRIKQIQSNHLSGSGFHELTDNMRTCCCKFLDIVEPENVESNISRDWGDLLYQCRNYVVHRQHAIAGKLNDEIMDICYILESICFFVSRNFFLENEQNASSTLPPEV